MKLQMWARPLAGLAAFGLFVQLTPIVAFGPDYIGECSGWSHGQRTLLKFGMLGAGFLLVLGMSAAHMVHRRRRKHPAGFCPQCGYCLVENETGRCPE
jgi:hypothetical protein